jgi:hypothetical protein
LKVPVLTAATALVAFGCTDYPKHIIPGQLYETARDCVDPTASIDIVDGPDPGSYCPPTCLVTPAGANGGPPGVYVTTECGLDSPPPLYDTSGTEPACMGALAAFARGDVCQMDGTSSCPADASMECGSADDGGEAGEGGD